MTPPVLVGALTAGAVGAVARFLVARALRHRAQRHLSATFLINAVGSFALGVVVGAPVGSGVLAVVGTGFLGAFTTFSTFALETSGLAGRSVAQSVRYAAVMVLACGAAAAVGHLTAGVFWP